MIFSVEFASVLRFDLDESHCDPHVFVESENIINPLHPIGIGLVDSFKSQSEKSPDSHSRPIRPASPRATL